jgi:hypothetical protein
MGMSKKRRIKCSPVTNLSTTIDMSHTGGRGHNCVSKTQRKSIFYHKGGAALATQSAWYLQHDAHTNNSFLNNII